MSNGDIEGGSMRDEQQQKNISKDKSKINHTEPKEKAMTLRNEIKETPSRNKTESKYTSKTHLTEVLETTGKRKISERYTTGA